MRYFIGLGANLGDRLTALRAAAVELARHGQLTARSRVFESAPVGGVAQPHYLNAAIALDTELAPAALLALCHVIERAHGRVREREQRFGPRSLDLDLLLAGERGEITLLVPGLELPHPRLHERAFALLPLLDLDARLVHPTLGRPLAELSQAALKCGQQIIPLSQSLDVVQDTTTE